MTALGIGARLKKERIGKGLALDDISRDTRIAPRFLEAIETEDYSSLPGLVFTRNFIRQYALVLNIDPEPLLAAMPKPDENTAPLPEAPARPRGKSSYHRDRQLRALAITSAWLAAAAIAGTVAYFGFHRYSIRIVASETRPAVVQAASPVAEKKTVGAPEPVEQVTAAEPEANRGAPALPNHPASAAAPVMISLTAHARAWIKLDADGKTVFMGTLNPDEMKDISANEQIELQTGNAGALSVSLNGKALDSLGREGQFREVRLTAEGPQFLQRDPRPPQSSDQL